MEKFVYDIKNKRICKLNELENNSFFGTPFYVIAESMENIYIETWRDSRMWNSGLYKYVNIFFKEEEWENVKIRTKIREEAYKKGGLLIHDVILERISIPPLKFKEVLKENGYR